MLRIASYSRFTRVNPGRIIDFPEGGFMLKGYIQEYPEAHDSLANYDFISEIQ
jgi:hypothetical protein